MSLKIVYWPIRGLVEQIVTLCEYTGVAYDLVKISTDGDSTEFWKSQKKKMVEAGWHFANLPYLQDPNVPAHETKGLSETWAILMYVAQKSGNKDLFPSMEQMVEYTELCGIVGDIKTWTTVPAYMVPTKEDFTAALTQKYAAWSNNKMKGIAERLEKNGPWFFGDQIKILDFYFAEVLEMMFDHETELGVKGPSEYPILRKYLDRFLALDKIKAYRSSSKFVARPYNNYMAAWK